MKNSITFNVFFIETFLFAYLERQKFLSMHIVLLVEDKGCLKKPHLLIFEFPSFQCIFNQVHTRACVPKKQLYKECFMLFHIVTTQPNINLIKFRLRLDIIIKPNPPHPTTQTIQASYLGD